MTKPAGIPTNGVNMILSTMIKAIMIPKLLDLISIFIRLPINPLIKSFTVIFSHLKIQSLFTMIHKIITISSPKLNLFFPSLYSIPHLRRDVTNHLLYLPSFHTYFFHILQYSMLSVQIIYYLLILLHQF